MKPIHVAVFGAGTFGRHHVRQLAAHPEVGRVSVVDACPDRAEAVAHAHGVCAAPADVHPDAAVVAVPTQAHHAITAGLIDRGIPVFVEKPLAATDVEARDLLERSGHAGTFLQVGHIERFSPAFLALQAGVRTPRQITIRRHNPPRPTPPEIDVVLDLMIHDVDLAMALAGSPVSVVTSAPVDADGQEAATARLHFTNGVVADLSASRLATTTERTMTVRAANGLWTADLTNGRLERCADCETVAIPCPGTSDKLAAELDAFVRAAGGAASPSPVDGTAGAEALAVANRIRTALFSTRVSQLSA